MCRAPVWCQEMQADAQTAAVGLLAKQDLGVR